MTENEMENIRIPYEKDPNAHMEWRYPQTDIPWLDYRLSKEVMNHLWDCTNNPDDRYEDSSIVSLAGNISKSTYIQDKNNWFYEHVLKGMTDTLYYKLWNNYYETIITKSRPYPLFKMTRLWVNYQRKEEFNPPHSHDGVFSFVVFMKIPTHWKEQHALPISKNSNAPHASDFQFLMGHGNGAVQEFTISLSPEDEGRILFFPAWLTHQVFPFYGTEEERITISGNIVKPMEDMESTEVPLSKKKAILEEMERQTNALKEIIDKDKKFVITESRV